MRNLLALSDLSVADIDAIWSLASRPGTLLPGTVGWSFEGSGIRTRTTFLQAFRDLGLQFTELPNLLKTNERVEDLAGYLDPFYSLFVIRERDHERLQAFARASTRPVINAMSGSGHPCEVLADAYFIDKSLTPLRKARICLWGPPTNVFRSWHELGAVLGLDVLQVCEERHHRPTAGVRFSTHAPARADVVVTDSWPDGVEGAPLTTDALAQMGSPALLPTPPFSIGKELLFDPVGYAGFAGYRQKELLLPVQKAILRFVANA